MRFINIVAYLAITGLTLSVFQNCSKAKFADVNAGALQESSLSATTITINDDAIYTNDTNVRVQIQMDKPLQMYVTNDPTCATGGQWQPFSKEIPWVLGEKNKTTSVFVKFKSDYTESACSSDSIVHDDIPPVLKLDNSVATFTNSASVAFSVSASDGGSGVDHIECPAGISSCVGPLNIANSTEGQQNKLFYAYDKAGNKSAPLNVSWLYDKTGPVISFNMTPASKTNVAAANFKIIGTDNFTSAANIKYKRMLDGGAAVDVTDTFTVTVTSEGDHSIVVEAYDQAGNKSNTITYAWKYGTKNPDLKSTKTPKMYDSAKSSFEFSGTDQFGGALAKYECSLNGAAYAACTSPVDLTNATLNQGSNSFKVKGTDSLGLFSEITYNWIYDNVKPTLVFSKFPADFTKNTSEEVQVTVTDGNPDTVEFFLDGTSKQKSTLNNYVFANLTEGKHTVKVIAVDKAGNTSDPLIKTFVSDFTKPVVDPIVVTTPTNMKNINVAVTASDTDTEPGNTISLYAVLDSSTNYQQFASPIALANLIDGTHSVKVYAVDKAGNQSITVMSNNFLVDTTAPVITFTKQPPANYGYVPGASNTVTVNFTTSDAGSGIQQYTCGMTVAGVSQTTGSFPCTQNQDLAIDASRFGDYVYSVRAIDNVGLMTTKSVSWTVSASFVSGTTTFDITSIENSKVDILLVVDNSKSMDNNQSILSSGIANLTTNLAGLDWRVAITTTDVTSSGEQGHLVKLGTGSTPPYYIDSNTASATSILQSYIKQGTSGDTNERGLTAARMFMDRVVAPGSSSPSNTNEVSFYRSDAVLATVILSDSDENDVGNTVYTNADLYLNGNTGKTIKGVYDVLPSKTYINHSIISLPGDSQCAKTSETAGTTYYGVSQLTDGISASICDADYGAKLKDFATNIIAKISSKTLSCAPVDANGDGKLDITVTYTPVSGSPSVLDPSTYTVTGKVLKFKSALNLTGSYKVDYICLAP